MITLHRSGQYRFYVNSGYNLEPPYICVKHEGHFAKFCCSRWLCSPTTVFPAPN